MYRVMNAIGWSDFTLQTYILAADVPAKPPSAPMLISVDASQITIQITPYTESNGAPIQSYELYMQESTTGTYAHVHTFLIDDSFVFSATALDLSMTEGLHYFFVYTATNSVGTSVLSNELDVALINYPAKPSAPIKIDSLSTLTSIFVTWDQMAANDLNVIGYKLWMDSGNHGDFQVVLDGANHPGLNYMSVENLQTGQRYAFKVAALNFNGAGPLSDMVLFFSCLPPREIMPPRFVSSTETSLTVDWTLPKVLNGCPL
jgi:hypothetical protein